MPSSDRALRALTNLSISFPTQLRLASVYQLPPPLRLTTYYGKYQEEFLYYVRSTLPMVIIAYQTPSLRSTYTSVSASLSLFCKLIPLILQILLMLQILRILSLLYIL